MSTLRPWPMKRVAERKKNNAKADRPATSEKRASSSCLARFDRSTHASRHRNLLSRVLTRLHRNYLSINASIWFILQRKDSIYEFCVYYEYFTTRLMAASCSTRHSRARRWLPYPSIDLIDLHASIQRVLPTIQYLQVFDTLCPRFGLLFHSTLGKRHGDASEPQAVRSLLMRSVEVI